MVKKQIKSTVAVFFVLVMMVCCLTACETKLNGTYKAVEGSDSYTFNKDNTVTMTDSTGIGVKGTYKIEDGKITLTLSALGMETSQTYDFEKKGNTIKIDGKEYKKQ